MTKTIEYLIYGDRRDGSEDDHLIAKGIFSEEKAREYLDFLKPSHSDTFQNMRIEHISYSTKDYVIVGDFEIYDKIESCLIHIIGEDYDEAVKVLNRMRNNPNEEDLYDLNKPNFRGNLQIEIAYDGWWHDSFLCN